MKINEGFELREMCGEHIIIGTDWKISILVRLSASMKVRHGYGVRWRGKSLPQRVWRPY